MSGPIRVSEMLRRPDKIPPVAVDGLEPLTQGAEESWGEWGRWYMSRHRSPLNRVAHGAGYALLLVSPLALLGRKWRVSLTLASSGLACIALGHALEGNMPTILAEPRRFFGKPVGALRQGLNAKHAN